MKWYIRRIRNPADGKWFVEVVRMQKRFARDTDDVMYEGPFNTWSDARTELIKRNGTQR